MLINATICVLVKTLKMQNFILIGKITLIVKQKNIMQTIVIDDALLYDIILKKCVRKLPKI